MPSYFCSQATARAHDREESRAKDWPDSPRTQCLNLLTILSCLLSKDGVLFTGLRGQVYLVALRKTISGQFLWSTEHSSTPDLFRRHDYLLVL